MRAITRTSSPRRGSPVVATSADILSDSSDSGSFSPGLPKPACCAIDGSRSPGARRWATGPARGDQTRRGSRDVGTDVGGQALLFRDVATRRERTPPVAPSARDARRPWLVERCLRRGARGTPVVEDGAQDRVARRTDVPQTPPHQPPLSPAAPMTRPEARCRSMSKQR